MVPHHRFWRLLQRVAVVGFVLALAACIFQPEAALPLLWSGVLPLLPLAFLVHPGLWRNVCPLATLGMGPDSSEPGSPGETVTAACLLLLALIPLRPLGLEGSALASAGLLAAAGGGAVLGRRRARKAGFCNAWCPILPVERLYGQRPLIALANPRCPACTVCTPRGCLDLSPRAASAQLLGTGRRGWSWLTSGFGAFAAAFPGVVLAFFLLPGDPGVLRAYGQVALGAGASWVAAAAVVAVTGVGWRVALPTLAALAAAPYAWFTVPGVSAVWGMPRAAGPLQGACLGLVVYWWLRAVRHADAGRSSAG